MPIRWKLFRVVCLLQMLMASYFVFTALIGFSSAGSFSFFLRMLLFLLIFLLAILGVNLLHNNYPDVPITGRQKTNFNRLFLLNFLFLSLLFGIIFSEYRHLQELSRLYDKAVRQLRAATFIPILIYLSALLFQLIILYGLYLLRKELYINFTKKEFDFEKDQLSR